MTTQTTNNITITEYAEQHDLDPADLVAIIAADPEPVAPVAADPLGRRIETRDGVYEDALYPVVYLDLAAAGKPLAMATQTLAEYVCQHRLETLPVVDQLHAYLHSDDEDGCAR